MPIDVEEHVSVSRHGPYYEQSDSHSRAAHLNASFLQAFQAFLHAILLSRFLLISFWMDTPCASRSLGDEVVSIILAIMLATTALPLNTLCH